MKPETGVMQTDSPPNSEKVPPQGLTFPRFYDKFAPVTGCDEDMPPE